jgi:hypothetical protein
MNKQFTISAAYQWPKSGNHGVANNSEKAIKAIVKATNKRFDTKQHKNGLSFKVAYKRLRASAGRTMLDSVIKRIETAQVVIVDITTMNANVYIELGIALYVCKNCPDFSVYLIKEKTDSISILQELPSDLQGYFVSTYSVTKTGVKFNDNNSLRMSIVSDVNDFYNKLGFKTEKIDEINFNDD